MKGRDSSLEAVLFKLGFPRSASRLYIDILRRGRTMVSELRSTSDSSLYDRKCNLIWLEEKGLILLRSIDGGISPLNLLEKK